MNRFGRVVAAAVIGLWLGGCYYFTYQDAAGEERRGNWAVASRKALETLEGNIGYTEARSLWSRVWPKYLSDSLADTDRFESKARWDEAVATLEDIQTMARRAQGLGLQAPMAPLDDRLNATRKLAAGNHYEAGIGAERAQAFRRAAIAFRTATRFVGDFKDAKARYEQNRAAATIRVALMPLLHQGGLYPRAELISQYLSQALLPNPKEFVVVVDHGALGTSAYPSRESVLAASRQRGVPYVLVGDVQVYESTPTDEHERRHDVKAAHPASGPQYQQPANGTPYQQPLRVDYRYHHVERQVTVRVDLELLNAATAGTRWQTSRASSSSDELEWIDDVSGYDSALPSEMASLRRHAPYELKGFETLATEAANQAAHQVLAEIETMLETLE